MIMKIGAGIATVMMLGALAGCQAHFEDAARATAAAQNADSAAARAEAAAGKAEKAAARAEAAAQRVEQLTMKTWRK